MKMRACLVELMRDNQKILDFIREKIEKDGVPKGDDLRVWKECFLPCVEMLLNSSGLFGRRENRKCLQAAFEMLDRMLSMEPETAEYVTVHTMEYLHHHADVRKAAKPYMTDALERAYASYGAAPVASEPDEQAAQEDATGLQWQKPGFGSAATVDQFAPIIPYVGAGGLRLGWTQEQVEKVTGPLGEYVPVAKLWRRYTVGDQLWLFFNGPGDGLEKIVTLPGYGGRLFSLIDTNTPVEELSWREPSLVWNETLKFYTSPKGVLIQPVDGKCTHITVFDDRWKELCQ